MTGAMPAFFPEFERIRRGRNHPGDPPAADRGQGRAGADSLEEPNTKFEGNLRAPKGGTMWLEIIGAGLLYLMLALTLGVLTLSHGRMWVFVLGIFFPIFWLFGAVSKPADM
jgi:hypothetical protein